MTPGKTIFAQLMDFVPAYEFRKCVERYNGNYKVGGLRGLRDVANLCKLS